jgi:hypothetical protein
MPRRIPLHSGLFATVDDEDFDWLTAIGHWRLFRNRPTAHAYAVTGRSVRMHRLILGAPIAAQVDHANGDGLDNRRSNLRLCSGTQNLGNQAKRTRATSSRFKGVARHSQSGRWQAYISVGGKRRHLGLFDSEADAARAYDSAAVVTFGAFARPNEGGVS